MAIKRARNAAKATRDWWQHESTCRELARQLYPHVIGLHLFLTVDGKPRDAFRSGFAFSVGDSLLWITAGHVIDEIDAIKRTNGVKVHVSRWVDAFPDRDASSIPFAIDEPLILSGTDQQLDVGAVLISGLSARGLLANRFLRPIPTRRWKKAQPTRTVGYYLAGFPEERVFATKRQGATGTIECRVVTDLVVLPVRHKQNFRPPRDMKPSDDLPLWWGQLPPEMTVKSVKGMSGGPVVSIQQTAAGRLSYRFVGVQASWFLPSRIIKVVPMQRLIDHFKRLASCK